MVFGPGTIFTVNHIIHFSDALFFSKKVLTTNNTANYTLTKDIIVVIIGLAVYIIIVHFHQYIAGVVIF